MDYYEICNKYTQVSIKLFMMEVIRSLVSHIIITIYHHADCYLNDYNHCYFNYIVSIAMARRMVPCHASPAG
jgi:hypothetical protein